MKVMIAKCKIWKRKLLKTNLIQFQLFIFDMPACLQQNIHGRVLSIRVFSADEYYDSVSPPMNTIASRDQSKPIRNYRKKFSGEL